MWNLLINFIEADSTQNTIPFPIYVKEIEMPLRARLNEKDIIAYEFDENSWSQLKASYKKETLIMPCCDN